MRLTSSLRYKNMFDIFLIICLGGLSLFSEGTPAPISKEIFVNPKGGNGVFTKIQDAIDKGVPEDNSGWILIHVAPGVYRESVTVPINKPYVYLMGQQTATTIVASTTTSGTPAEAVFTVIANNFIAQRMTFKNTLNVQSNAVKPAVAASVQGDKNAFYDCNFIGLQDTLFDYAGHHLFHSCYIEGAVDFIFGGGTSRYQGCTLNATGQGYITAQKRESPKEESGFVFKSARVIGSGPTYLGRGYGAYSRVLFYKSRFSNIVEAKGWDAWRYAGHEGQLTYAEVECTGEGANTSQRVPWMKKLSEEELESLIGTSFIDKEGWLANQPLKS